MSRDTEDIILEKEIKLTYRSDSKGKFVLIKARDKEDKIIKLSSFEKALISHSPNKINLLNYGFYKLTSDEIVEETREWAGRYIVYSEIKTQFKS